MTAAAMGLLFPAISGWRFPQPANVNGSRKRRKRNFSGLDAGWKAHHVHAGYEIPLRQHRFRLENLFRKNATYLSWSPRTVRLLFGTGALWITDAGGSKRKKDRRCRCTFPTSTIRAPRFSPDSLANRFHQERARAARRSVGRRCGNGTARPLVVDRPTENPFDVAWINGGQRPRIFH